MISKGANHVVGGRAQFKLQLITEAARGSEEAAVIGMSVPVDAVSCLLEPAEELGRVVPEGLSLVSVTVLHLAALLGHAVLLPR